MSKGLCGALLTGLLVAACSSTETRTVVVPANDACSYYGYTPGTEAYRICAEREAAARARGRMAADSDARIVSDAQAACVSYGLARGSAGYDRCVQREVTFRRPA